MYNDKYRNAEKKRIEEIQYTFNEHRYYMDAHFDQRQTAQVTEGMVRIFNGSRHIVLNVRAYDAGGGEVILCDVEAHPSTAKACESAASAKRRAKRSPSK